MPQITTQVPDLRLSGAIIQVFIFPPVHTYFKPEIKPEEIPIFTAVGMIDTGASISGIDVSIAKHLNLISRDFIPILTPSGIKNHYTYDIDLMLPQTLGFKKFTLEVTGSDLIRQGIQVLIGRDVLKECTFVYNGSDNTWHLTV